MMDQTRERRTPRGRGAVELPAALPSWLAEWAQTWSVPALPTRARFEVGARLRTSLGRCHPRDGNIRLHRALLDEPETLLREICCHEAAHLAVFLRHGPRARAHGPEWAALMVAAGYEPRVRMAPARLSAEFQRRLRPRVLYEHRCPVCSASCVARRPVRNWRCRACRTAGLEGHLEISKRLQSDPSTG